MNVKNLMTAEPRTCSVSDHLATAAMKMWEDDCGILPVVEDGALQGVITDRDIAMALVMKGTPATHVRVGEVISGHVFQCTPDDEVAEALETMREHRVRRLPVLEKGKLVGILSLNDIVLEAASSPGPQKKPTYKKIVSTLQAICEHRNLAVAA